MNMKKFIAGFASAVVAASAAMAVSASAAERTVEYTQSAASKSTDDAGVCLRANIYNIWTSSAVEDMKNTGGFNDEIVVNFTVSGIGDDSVKVNDDKTTEPLYAYLGGQIGGNPSRHKYDEIPADEIVAINGDGDYTAVYKLGQGSETVECLYLQTNINIFAYGTGLAETSANITINSITTDDGVEESTDPTDAPTDAPVTTAADEDESKTTTTAKPSDDKKTTTTTAKADDKKTTTAAPKAGETAANTGDAGVVTAVAALGIAAACAFVVRKRK